MTWLRGWKLLYWYGDEKRRNTSGLHCVQALEIVPSLCRRCSATRTGNNIDVHTDSKFIMDLLWFTGEQSPLSITSHHSRSPLPQSIVCPLMSLFRLSVPVANLLPCGSPVDRIYLSLQDQPNYLPHFIYMISSTAVCLLTKKARLLCQTLRLPSFIHSRLSTPKICNPFSLVRRHVSALYNHPLYVRIGSLKFLLMRMRYVSFFCECSAPQLTPILRCISFCGWG